MISASVPIDLHVKAFEKLGAKVNVGGGCIEAVSADGVHGSSIYFDCSSVGATINTIIAAVLADGSTVIENAAREPHIVDLANFLNACGADIRGAGTPIIRINGVKELHGCEYTIIPDMIEAGTFMVAAAATRGKLYINNVIPKHLETITAKLREMGVIVEEFDEAVMVSRGKDALSAVNVKTLPYPGFPTDMNPQMTVLLCLADGTSQMSETIWNNRFRYVDELQRMGRENQGGRQNRIYRRQYGVYARLCQSGRSARGRRDGHRRACHRGTHRNRGNRVYREGI